VYPNLIPSYKWLWVYGLYVMQRNEPTADCDECEDGTVRPYGPVPEYVCGLCDAEMTPSRFASAKYE